MTWPPVETDGPYDEHERPDGLATVRIRERSGDGFVVRLDVLEQASTGPAYRRETRTDREAADALAARWMAEFDAA